jgi:hypothetical protein
MKNYIGMSQKQKVLFEFLFLVKNDINKIRYNNGSFFAYLITIDKRKETNISLALNISKVENGYFSIPRIGASLEVLGLVESKTFVVNNKKIVGFKINEVGEELAKKLFIPFDSENRIIPFLKNEIKVLNDFEDMLLEGDGIYSKLDKQISDTKKWLERALNTSEKDVSISKVDFKPQLFANLYDNFASTLIEDYNEKLTNNKDFFVDAKSKIIEQSKENGGFVVYVNHKTNEKLLIPKIPFIIWIIEQNQYTNTPERVWDLKHSLINSWECVVGSNLKLPNDSKYHNDWVVGAGFDYKIFYKLMDEEYSWFSFAIMDFYHEYIMKDDFNYLDDIIQKTTDKNFVSKQKNNVDFNAYTKILNKDLDFPIYFRPYYSNNALNISKENIDGFISAVAIKEFDENLIDLGLNIAKNPKNLVFTNNGSKAAHIVNVAKDIGLNIFEIDIDVSKLDHNNIYEISRENDRFKVSVVSSVSYNTVNFIPLQDIEKVKNKNNFKVSSKALNLSKLYNEGIKTLPAFLYIDGKEKPIIMKGDVIARSCGSLEGSLDASFSGIFESIVLNGTSFNESINKVLDSFSSSRAKKYAKVMNVDLPKAGILFQKFIEADFSCVAKLKDGMFSFDYADGGCEKIVSGSDSVKTISFNSQDDVLKTDDVRLNELFIVVNDVISILGFNNIEIEAVYKDNSWFIVQAIEIKGENNIIVNNQKKVIKVDMTQSQYDALCVAIDFLEENNNNIDNNTTIGNEIIKELITLRNKYEKK